MSSVESWHFGGVSAKATFSSNTAMEDVNQVATKWVKDSGGVLEACHPMRDERGMVHVTLSIAEKHAPYDQANGTYLPISEQAATYIRSILGEDREVARPLWG